MRSARQRSSSRLEGLPERHRWRSSRQAGRGPGRSPADDSLGYSAELPNDPALVFPFRRWVLTWGRSVAVIEPGWFRERIAAGLAAAYATAAVEDSSEGSVPVYVTSAE